MSEAMEVPVCRRRESRHDVELGAFAYQDDGSRSVVALSDISYTGCRFAGGPDLAPAEKVWLVMPSFGRAIAEVCWSDSGRTGARFHELDAEMETDEQRDDSQRRFSRPGIARFPLKFGKKGTRPAQAAAA